MVFKLAQPTYVQFVHATGDSDDYNYDWEGWDVTPDPTDPTGHDKTCSIYGNYYWIGVEVYVGNSADITDLTQTFYCGQVSSSAYMEDSDLADHDSFLDMVKSGGSVRCDDVYYGSSQYVILNFNGAAVVRPCNIGIFSCQCT